MKTKNVMTALSFTLCALLALSAGAEEVLPKPEQPFAGKIARTAKESTPDFPKGIEAPKGADRTKKVSWPTLASTIGRSFPAWRTKKLFLR